LRLQVRAVYGALHASKADFTTEDVIALVSARPELARLNGRIETNEGYRRSLTEDPE